MLLDLPYLLTLFPKRYWCTAIYGGR